MSRKLGVIMDPIENINTKKDSTYAMLLAAQARGWTLQYMEQPDLYVLDGQARARMQTLEVFDDSQRWFVCGNESDHALADLDVILMRKDPPFNMEYIYTTYILELAERDDVLVINRPQSLRDANEKLFAAWFPQCMPPTLVSRDAARLRRFIADQQDVILKPLDGMGGASIFRVKAADANTSVIIETLTDHGQRSIMAQRFIPEITEGDKRILMINGEPVPYALARIPAKGEVRGNLAAGGSGVGIELSERDRWICGQVGAELRKRGLMFVGLDVIGDFLTEVNVTSPTCIRELDAQFNLDIGGQLMEAIDTSLA